MSEEKEKTCKEIHVKNMDREKKDEQQEYWRLFTV
jgi:hypothetical protein